MTHRESMYLFQTYNILYIKSVTFNKNNSFNSKIAEFHENGQFFIKKTTSFYICNYIDHSYKKKTQFLEIIETPDGR